MMVSEDRLHQNAYAFWLLSLPQLATGKSSARRRPAASPSRLPRSTLGLAANLPLDRGAWATRRPLDLRNLDRLRHLEGHRSRQGLSLG